MNVPDVIPNNPREWGKIWNEGSNATANACYPLDGRETIWEPYERLVSTATVGDYRDALDVALGVPTSRYYESVPEDLFAYLNQRVIGGQGLDLLDADAKIDRFGRIS
jgi:hypothetical protein